MIKRTLDILLSGILLLILALPLAIIVVILKLTGEREAFYFQERVGQFRKEIKVSKFVTMLRNSPSMGSQDITLRNDPRVLPVGKFLRKTKLNEFPQFWDVFVGKLSLVGWRPLMPKGFADYSQDIQNKIVTVKPGLTGLGSLVFRDEEAIIAHAQSLGRDLRTCYREDIMPFKGALECWYVDNQSTSVDFKILVATLLAVLMPKWKGYQQWFHRLPNPHSKLIQEFYNGKQTSATEGTPVVP
jgi:lipopolysaccharide/colanic/teichoic acid biosynthesis glycosyltransferase